MITYKKAIAFDSAIVVNATILRAIWNIESKCFKNVSDNVNNYTLDWLDEGIFAVFQS